MTDTAVGIVGAGIAGLTLAHALDARGIPATVFEQADSFDNGVGAGIQLAPNAVNLLEGMGLGKALRQICTVIECVRMRRFDTGEVLAVMELGEAAGERYGAPYYTVHRGDLHGELLRGLQVPVHTGCQLNAVERLSGRGRLVFSDNTVHDSPVVVGADGIRSAVRRELHDDRPRYAGQAVYRGLVDASRLAGAACSEVTVWMGPDRHLVSYPVRGGALLNVVATFPSSDPQQLESWCEPGDLVAVRNAYREWHGDVRAVLGALDAVTIWSLYDRDPIDTWVAGPIALIGDAAHPMLPFRAQGANQAVEDALVLAQCLSTITGISEALAHYQDARTVRANEIAHHSRSASGRMHLGQASRDELTEYWRLSNQDWLFGYRPNTGVALAT